MTNLSLIERLQLVKAGYNRKEIDKMILAESEAQSAAEEPAENAAEGAAEPEQAKAQEEPAAEAEDAPDYKQLFEDLKKEHEDTLQKLDAAQKKNAAADVSGNVQKKDTQTVINDIFRNVLD